MTWMESCNDTLRETTDAIFALRETMAEAGVEDFIYVGYGYQPSPVTKPGLDLSRQLWMEGCSETDTPHCYFVDNVVELMGKIRSDGIHPTGRGLRHHRREGLDADAGEGPAPVVVALTSHAWTGTRCRGRVPCPKRPEAPRRPPAPA